MLLAKNYTQGTMVWFAMLGLTIALIGVAFLTTWLWLRSGSIWPTVLLHACHNVLIFYLFEPLTRAQPITPYIGGEHGLGMMLVTVLAALLITRMARKLPGQAGQRRDDVAVAAERLKTIPAINIERAGE